MDINHELVNEKVTEYESQHPAYAAYADFLRTVLARACKRLMPYVIVESRPKTIASFAEKIVRKQWKFENIPGYDITDRCGARVITQTAEEKALACAYVEKHFLIDRDNSLDQKTQHGEREFGYLAVHYVVQIPGSAKEMEGQPVPATVQTGPDGFKAEVQVKTLLEHAWANPLHDRLYKVQITPPRQIKREAASLAATLEHSDERLGSVADDVDAFLGHYAAYMAPDKLNDEIKIVDAAIKALEGKGDVQQEVAQRLRLGRLYRLAGHTEMAVRVWNKSVKAPSPYREALRMELGYGKCVLSREKPDGGPYRAGMKLLRQAAESGVTDCQIETAAARRIRAEAARRLAWAYSNQQGKEVDARDWYRRALDLDPANPYHLSDFLSHEIYCSQNAGLAHPMRHYIDEAIRTCARHIAVGIEQPRAQFTMGRLQLLVGRLDQAMDAYLKAVRVLLKSSPHLQDTPITDELEFMHRINLGRPLQPEQRQICQLLRLARAVRRLRDGASFDLSDVMSPHARRLKPGDLKRALVVVGGAGRMSPREVRSHVNVIRWALEHTDGLVLSGGTRVGIPGVVGQEYARLHAKRGKRIQLVGYVPSRLPTMFSPDSERYDLLIKTDGDGFSALEPIQAWVDMLGIGLRPEDVRILGFEGGQIAAVEYRLALTLGAKVAVVPGSGRAVDDLLNDPEWSSDPDLIKLYRDVHDEATVRAFVRPAAASFQKEQLDELGAIVHAAYLRESPYSDVDPVRQPYKDLRSDLQNSNRQQVLYAAEILASEGYSLEFVGKPGEIIQPEFSPEQIARMAELEHGRWNMERLAAGWKPTPARTKDAAKRTNPNLTTWARLEPGARKYDFDAIHNYAELLKQAGYRIVKPGVEPIGKPLAMSVKVLIRNDRGRYLAIRRSGYSKHNAGKWDLPGGKVDPGENFTQALTREVQEETGLTIRPRHLVGSAQSEAPSKIVVYIILMADLVRGKVRISHEHTEYRWTPPDRFAKLDFCEQFREITDHPGQWPLE